MSRFDALSEQLKAMQNAGLEDTPTYERLLTLALEAAPDSLKSYVMDLAVQEGRLPPPVGYDQNGEKLGSVNFPVMKFWHILMQKSSNLT